LYAIFPPVDYSINWVVKNSLCGGIELSLGEFWNEAFVSDPAVTSSQVCHVFDASGERIDATRLCLDA
jgi:hypothetical protein